MGFPHDRVCAYPFQVNVFVQRVQSTTIRTIAVVIMHRPTRCRHVGSCVDIDLTQTGRRSSKQAPCIPDARFEIATSSYELELGHANAGKLYTALMNHSPQEFDVVPFHSCKQGCTYPWPCHVQTVRLACEPVSCLSQVGRHGRCRAFRNVRVCHRCVARRGATTTLRPAGPWRVAWTSRTHVVTITPGVIGLGVSQECVRAYTCNAKLGCGSNQGARCPAYARQGGGHCQPWYLWSSMEIHSEM